MSYRFGIVLFLAAFAAVGLVPAQDKGKAVKEEPLVEQVRKSIDRGIKFLRDQQQNGSWESEWASTGWPNGCTSLTLLALLNAGVKPEDPVIQRGLEYLRAKTPSDEKDMDAKVYVVGLMAMVFAEAGQNVDLIRIEKCVKWLINARTFDGNGNLLGWGYGMRSTPADNSNSQYALLGLHAGQAAGVKVPREVWKSIQQFYIDSKKPDGGWIYRDSPVSSPSLTMTTAGLCGLLIAGMELNAGREIFLADGGVKNCGKYDENPHIGQALGWVTRHFTYDLSNGRNFYNFYGIERTGRLSGLRFIGEHDWYREGCVRLVKMQKDNGAWQVNALFDNMAIVSTSFALLFLSKGRTPILINKLAHGDPLQRQGPNADWNNDRHDVRNLVNFASKELFKTKPLAWQVFDASRVQGRWTDPEVFQEKLLIPMLESPIAYFNGHRAPGFTGVEEKLLKEYIEQGGFILAEACCGRKEFDIGFRALVKKLFEGAELQRLTPDHPIFVSHFDLRKSNAELWGIQLGCKTVVVYSPHDLSCRWEANKPDDPAGMLAFRIGTNIVAYATGKEPPKPRLTEVQILSTKGEPDKIPRGFLKVAQLRHDGDWHPAPQAMHNLMLDLRNNKKLDVALQKKEITVSDPSLTNYRFLYMHGRNAFSFGERELQNLKNNLETGGLLFADACCGRAAFDKAFREFIPKLFPGRALERIPPSDDLFSREINGQAITTVRVRKESPGGEPAGFRDEQPFLEGIKFENRWVVIYSKYDIGCALEKHQSTDCLGHDYDSAIRLGRAAVLYTLKR